MAILCAPIIPWAYSNFKTHLPLLIYGPSLPPLDRASRGNDTSTHFVSIPPNTSGSSVNMFSAQLHFPHWNGVNSIKCLQMSWLALHVSNKSKIETKFSNGDFFFSSGDGKQIGSELSQVNTHSETQFTVWMFPAWISSSMKENLALGTLEGFGGKHLIWLNIL